MNPLNVLKGWYRSKIYASIKQKKLSKQRLKICSGCIHLKDSSMLKFINGDYTRIKTKKCDLCSCPVVEKSMVKEENCKANKW